MKNVFFVSILLVLALSVGAQSSVPDTFIRINGGTFTMGSPANEPSRWEWTEGPQHRVTISAFYMGKYLVTQKEYEDVTGYNPSHFKGPNLPVEKVTWYEAVEYCNKLSQKEGLTPSYTIRGRTPAIGYPIIGAEVTWNRNANGYRLPTDAEWEYACRAGTTTPFNTGNNITTNQANYNGNYPYNNNTKGIYRQKTTDVGSFAPNVWGLYDMHGNVFEWCSDMFREYSNSAQANPIGPTSGYAYVIRGGYYASTEGGLRSAFRVPIGPDGREDLPSEQESLIGFRLVRP